MKNRIQKTAIILVAAIAIGLTAGNPLLAQDRETVGLITAADMAFIQAEPQGIVTEAASLSRGQTISLISAADLAFISQPFSIASSGYRVRFPATGAGLITAADYQFITGVEIPDIYAVYNDLSDSMAGSLAK